MAAHSEPRIYGYTAGEDLSSKQYHFVKFGADKETVLGAGANERAIGVLMNAPENGEQAEVALPGGGAKLKVAESVSLGKMLTSTAASKGEVADAAGEWIGAVAYEDGSSDDIVGVEVTGFQAHASDA